MDWLLTDENITVSAVLIATGLFAFAFYLFTRSRNTAQAGTAALKSTDSHRWPRNSAARRPMGLSRFAMSGVSAPCLCPK
jgi:hypothetical protein